jgi:hypothetical protein
VAGGVKKSAVKAQPPKKMPGGFAIRMVGNTTCLACRTAPPCFSSRENGDMKSIVEEASPSREISKAKNIEDLLMDILFWLRS